MSSRFGLRFVATMTTVSLLAIAMIVNTGRAADAPPSTVSVLQGTLTFVASPGSVNDVSVEPSENGAAIAVSDPQTSLAAESPCQQIDPHTALCPADIITSISTQTKNEDDRISNLTELPSELAGGAGNDTILPGSSGDILRGGQGIDTVDYANAPAGVIADLTLHEPQPTGASGEDEIQGFEGISGSAFDDVLLGTNGANTFDGAAGNDVVAPRLGADEVHGGDGLDVVNYGERHRGVEVSLNELADDGVVGERDNVHSDIEGVFGGAGPDRFDGNSGLNGFLGYSGADVFVGNGGDDYFAGGGGLDTIDLSTVSGPASIDLGNAEPQDYGAGLVAFQDVENVIGTAGADTLIGSGRRNYLDGADGDDALSGRGGDDEIEGGPGDDTIVGGAGVDTASYRNSVAGVLVDLALDGPQDTRGAGIDQVSSTEDLVGSAYADQLRGDGRANTIVAGAGSDELWSRGGDDILLLRDGENDTARCGAGDDRALLDASDATDCERSLDRDLPGTTVTGDARDGQYIATSNPVFEFASDDPDAHFECAVDPAGGFPRGVVFEPCNTPFTAPAFELDGAHRLLVRAVNTLGMADESPARIDFVLDTTAPTVTWGSYPQKYEGGTRAHFEFEVQDAIGPTSASCAYDDGAFEPCASPLEIPSPTGLHRLSVRASDAAGNTAQIGGEEFYSFDPARLVTFDPDPPANMGTMSGSIAFTASIPVRGFSCSVTTVTESGYQSSSSCSNPYRVASYDPNGHATMRVWALDEDHGNAFGQPAVAEFEVDTVSPRVHILDKPSISAPSSDSAHSFAFTAEDAGAVHFECALNGNPAEPCESPWQAGPLPACVSSVAIAAIDAAGNRAEDRAMYWHEPEPSSIETRVDCPPDRLDRETFTGQTAALVDGEAGPAGTRFYCKMNGRPWIACSGAGDAQNRVITRGTQTLQVAAAFDGQRDPHPAAISWEADWGAEPTRQVRFDLAPPTEAASPHPPVRFRTVVETAALFECSLDGADWQTCESPMEISGPAGGALAQGHHEFRVRVVSPEPIPSVATAVEFNVTGALTAPRITSGPASGDHVSGVAEYSFSGQDLAGTYSCSIDGGAFAPCSSPLTMPTGGPARRTFAVRAERPGAAPGAAASRHYYAQEPGSGSAGIGVYISGGALDGSTVTELRQGFTFAATDDGASFQCQIDGGEYAPCESPDAHEFAVGAHTFAVRALSPATGLYSSAATRSFTVEAPPWRWGAIEFDTGFDEPSDEVGSMADPTAPEFRFHSNVPAASFECAFDNQEVWTPCASPVRFEPQGSAEQIGWHSLQVRFASPQVDSGPSSRLFFVRGNQLEQIAAQISPVAGDVEGESWSELVDGIEVSAGSIDVRAHLAGLGDGPDGPEALALRCKVDGDPWKMCASNFHAGGLSRGPHNLHIRTPDAEGHRGFTDRWEFTVNSPSAPDGTISAPQITGGPDGETIGDAEAEFAFVVPSDHTAACRVDDDDFQPCFSPFATRYLENGPHTFDVRTVDSDGNVSQSTSRSFRSEAEVDEFDYGELVSGEDGDRLTPGALEALRRTFIETLAAPDAGQAPQAGARTLAFGESSAFQAPRLDKQSIVAFLRAVDVYPTKRQFIEVQDPIWSSERSVEIEFHATYRPPGGSQRETTSIVAARQDFQIPGADQWDIQNQLGYFRRQFELWSLRETDATGAPLAQSRLYASGQSYASLSPISNCGNDFRCMWDSGRTYRTIYGGSGGGCQPTNAMGIPDAYSFVLGPRSPTYGELAGVAGEVETIVDSDWRYCRDETLSPPAREVHVEHVSESISVEQAYDAYATDLEYRSCDAQATYCRTLSVNLDDIDPAKAAAACKLPQFQAVCLQYGNALNLDGLGDPDAPAGEPVNAATGNFTLSKTDVEAGGVGLSLAFTRTYNSMDERSSAVGSGWSWAGSERLRLLSSGNMRYRRADGKTFDFKLQDDGSFAAPYGHDERLTLASGAYQITDPYGSLTTVFRSDGLVDHVRDKQGRPIEYQYDGADRLIAQTTSNGQWIHYSYAADGMLERVADSNGRSAYLSHEGMRLESVRNPQDGLVRYDYDAGGFLTEAINPDGSRALANSYKSNGQVLAQSVGEDSSPMTFSFGERATRVRDPAGNWALVRYDKYGRTSSVTTERAGRTVLHRGRDGIVNGLTRADGRTAGLAFDSSGRITRLKTFAGETVETEYDAASNVKSITDQLGRTTSFAYDEGNFVTSATDARGKQTRFGWRNGLLGSVTNAVDEVTSYSYDDQGRITSVTDPSGQRTSRQYDQHGYLSKSTDELGRESLTEHSPMGQLTASIDAAGARTDFTHDANGNLTQTRDALGNLFSTEYDARQQPVASYVNGRLASRTEYDEVGRVTARTDANGNTERSFYGPDGRLARSVNAEHETTNYRYDELGRVTRQTDPKGNATQFEYDHAGNLTAVIDATGAATRYTYDAAGQLSSQLDALGNLTTYSYDEGGNLSRVQQPGGSITSFEYDAAGRLAARVVAGERTEFTRDDNGRIVAVTLANGSQQHFTYDPVGRLQSATDADGAPTTFAYDPVGRIQATTDALGMTTTYSYDQIGQIISSADPAGTTTYRYDDQQRLVEMTTPEKREHHFTYDNEGNVTRAEVFRPSAGGLKLAARTARFYDRTGRLTSSYTRAADGRLLSSLAYHYDENGNPTLKKTGSSEQRYSYDAADRLTRVESASGAGTRADTYTYDAAGNRASKNGEPYSYNQLGQLTAAPGGITFTYDPQGRRSARHSPAGSETYAWDSLDQLTSRTNPSGTTSTYQYDAFSRLTSATESGLIRTYNYAAADSPQRIATSLTTGGGALSRSEHLTYGPSGLIEQRTNDQPPQYPLADAAGNLIAQIDEQGAASELPGLDPWGAAAGNQSALDLPTAVDSPTAGFLGAAGRITLPGSELTKLGARYYDPEVGVFLSVDPVTGDPAEPTRRAPYNYAASNPAAFIDPSGESFSSMLGSAYEMVATPIKTKAEAIDQQLAEISSDPGAGQAAHTSANFLGPIVALASCESFDATALNLTTAVFPYGRVGTYLLNAGRGLGRLGPRLADELGALAIPAKTPWGWTGTQAYRAAVRQVDRGGTLESVGGQIPTQSQAKMLIEDAGGRMNRIEGPHTPPNPHTYPHINYTTRAGLKGTVRTR